MARRKSHSAARRGRRLLTHGRRADVTPLHRRLRFEPLEDRRLLAVLTVTTTADNFDFNDGLLSLREAIATANVAGGDTINFAPSLTSGAPATINLTNLGQLVINRSLTINGPGAGQLTIRAFDPSAVVNNGTRVFYIDDGNGVADKTVSISGLTLTGGDAHGDGGAVLNREHLTITASTISGSIAFGDGGGIFSPGLLSVSSSTISGNTAFVDGGGIFSPGLLSVSSSTISGNGANVDGGGIFSSGSLSVSSSTISGNFAEGKGGGIVSFGSLSVSSSTISGTASGGGGGIWALNGGRLDHTIVAGSIGGIDSLVTTFSLIGGDPLLGTLADNGGPTQTHALLAGSPAIDAGDAAAVAGVGGVPEFDQRGAPFSRVVGARIDIGAVERQTLAGLSLVVDTLADTSDGDFSPGNLSLREAIGLANSSLGANTITFAAALTSGGPATITLSGGEFRIVDAVTIQGPGANLLTIDASGNDPTPAQNNGDGSRVFYIGDGDPASALPVQISGLTLTGGDVGSSDRGGAISNLEYLFVHASVISGNSAGVGGGISNNYGRLTVTDTTISANSAAKGGGVHSWFFALEAIGIPRIINSTLSGNTALVAGGGIYNFSGRVDIQFSTITANDAPAGYGSGIASRSGATVETSSRSSIIAGNLHSDVDVILNPPDTTNSFVSFGYNLVGTGTGTGAFTFFDQTGVANPLLGPLADNGGPSKTHAVLPGSTAIDHGDPDALIGDGITPSYDQRGAPFTRVYDGDGGGAQIDIGAFELQPIAPALLGDYNLDGTVNAADYTIWRDTLGSATDLRANGDNTGPSAGVIDQADYALWKANFGNTFAGSGGGALVSARSVQAIADETPGVGKSDAPAAGPLAEPLVKTAPFDSAGPSGFIPTVNVVSRDRLRSSGPHAGQRDWPVIAARHDRALVAWLAARPTELRDELAATSLRELPSEPNVCDPSDEFIERLDKAFELLGV